jgi:hypothetical protein
MSVKDALKKAKSTSSSKTQSKDRFFVEDPSSSMVERAVRIRQLEVSKKETERELKDLKADLVEEVQEIREKECLNGNYVTNVEFNYDDENSIQTMFKKPRSPKSFDADEHEESLNETFGEENVKRLFDRKHSLTFKKSALNTDEKLEEVVGKLMKVLSIDEFALMFDYQENLVAAKDFDEVQYEILNQGQRNAALNELGIKPDSAIR